MNKVLRESAPSTPSQCSTLNCCYGEEKHSFPAYFKVTGVTYFFTAYIRVKQTVRASIAATVYRKCEMRFNYFSRYFTVCCYWSVANQFNINGYKMEWRHLTATQATKCLNYALNYYDHNEETTRAEVIPWETQILYFHCKKILGARCKSFNILCTIIPVTQCATKRERK